MIELRLRLSELHISNEFFKGWERFVLDVDVSRWVEESYFAGLLLI